MEYKVLLMLSDGMSGNEHFAEVMVDEALLRNSTVQELSRRLTDPMWAQLLTRWREQQAKNLLHG